MKRLLYFLALLLLSPGVRADLIKQSSTYTRLIYMQDSTSPRSPGVAGLTLTITASKAGAAFAAITPTVTDLGSGWYSLSYTTAHTNTFGALALKITATGADETDALDQIVAFDPADASLLGLTGVATAATQTSQGTTLGTINTNASTAATQATSANTQATAANGKLLGNVAAQTGDAFALIGTRVPNVLPTFPAGFSTLTLSGIAANILATPANLLATDASGRVLLQPTQTGVTIPTVSTVTNAVVLPTVAPSGYGGAGLTTQNIIDIWNYTSRTLTGFAFTPNVVNVTGTLPTVTLPTTPPAGYGNNGYLYVPVADVQGGSTTAALVLTVTNPGSSTTHRTLSWTADTTATGYKVLRSTNGITYTAIATVASSVTTYIDTARPASATVYYSIIASH